MADSDFERGFKRGLGIKEKPVRYQSGKNDVNWLRQAVRELPARKKRRIGK